MNQQVVSLWRPPFRLGSPEQRFHPAGTRVSDIVAAASVSLPEGFGARGVVKIGEATVPRAMWGHVKIKSGEVVTLHMPLADDGEGGGGKQVLGVVAALALTVATAGIASAGIPALGIAGGSLGASALAAGVGIAGSLILGALSPPPALAEGVEAEGQGQDRLEPASVEGNVLQPNAAVPRVIGTRRVFPPLAAEPFVELVGQDEIVEAVYALAGPHKLEDFRLGEADVEVPANEVTDLEIEAQEGTSDDEPLQLATRQGRTNSANIQLSTHKVDPTDGSVLDPDAADPLPVWHALATRDAPDETWLQFRLDGLVIQGSTGASVRIPLRIRMRRRGETTWRRLPELHYMNNTQSPQRLQVRLFWGDAFDDTLPSAPSSQGFVYARKEVPAQNVQPTGGGWSADSYFSAGAGDDIYESGTASTTNVQNVTLHAERVDVYLDSASWPEGEYEIEVKRGAAFRDSDFDSTSYEFGGGTDIIDFFGRRDSGDMPLDRDGLLDRLGLVRLVNIWNQSPVMAGGNAIVALRATNRRVERLSVKASGYVYDLSVEPGLSLTQTFPVGPVVDADFVPEFDTARAVDAVFACDVVFPETPTDGCLFEKGGSVQGVWVGLRDGGTIFRVRAGDGSTEPPNSDAAFIDITDFPQDGQQHTVIWDITMSDNRVRLWIDGVLKGTATSADGFFGDIWAGSGDGGYGDGSNVNVVGEPTSGWPGQPGSVVSELRYYFDQNGTIFRTTSNPAAHYRDVLVGGQNFDPLPGPALDEETLEDWHARCAANGYTCDFVAEGNRLGEVLRIIASCGFARPTQSEVWGVAQDYDRSAEAPVQIFTPRNSRGFQWRRAFARLPSGFRVNFRDRDRDYTRRQITVRRRGASAAEARLEQVTFDGLVTESDVVRRALYDLDQAEQRSAFYTLTAPAEAIVCRRGSLVGVQHDVLVRHHGAARVVSTTTSGGNVEKIQLDAPVQVKNETELLSVADLLAVDDMLDVGVRTGVAIRRTDGTVTVHEVSDATGETDELTLATPVPDGANPGGPFDDGSIPDIGSGCLVSVGALGREFRRLLVTEITPRAELTARLTMVDEAPELVAGLAA